MLACLIAAMRGAFAAIRRFWADTSGSVVQIVAFGMPALAMLSIGAIELSTVASHKGSLQAAADASALHGAGQIWVAREGVVERAKAFAMEQVADVAKTSTVTAVAELVNNNTGVKVTLTGHRPSFFGNLLPPGGFTTTATATAMTMNTLPLCMLAIQSSDSKVLNLLDQTQIKAPNCLIHSNKDVVAESSSKIYAGAVQASGTGSGQINPALSTGAPQTDDPFASLETKTTAPCTDHGKILSIVGILNLVPPGVHCGKWMAPKGTSLQFMPGTHYFRGAELQIKDDATLYGRDVVLVFDKGSKLKFQDEARVDLEGRKSGPLAGFLIITARDHTNDLEIWSDNVDNLLGVIYAPNAKLVVIGKDEIAEDSDWTVIVAKEIQLKDTARLVMNTGYVGSPVPVPTGVGPSGDVRLER